MDVRAEAGRIAWHDLLTNRVELGRRFYAELFGWEYEIEHATDFTWTPGEESDYPLIIANGQAHGGFVDPGQEIESHWLPWIVVEDVDAVAAAARGLGATVEREPWDTPGVGRGAVIRDPQGARFCPHFPTHDFPPPTGSFLSDVLFAEDIDAAAAFYGSLFDWDAGHLDIAGTKGPARFIRAGGAEAALAVQRPSGVSGAAFWLACLATDDLDSTVARATTSGATVRAEEADVPGLGRLVVLTDPVGATFGVASQSVRSPG